MLYDQIIWNSNLSEIMNLANSELFLIRDSKGVITLFKVEGNLPTDTKFRMRRLSDAKYFELNEITNSKFAVI